MKQVVSISLGSPNGDFVRNVELAGQQVRIVREGTSGDFAAALSRIAHYDGQVDAIGLGGIDIFLYVNNKQYVIGDGKRLAAAAATTPVVDGSGLKDSLERHVVQKLLADQWVRSESKVLMVSALDRFGMAETFVNAGCSCVFGDLIFNIGLDYPLTTLQEIEELAEKYRSRLLTVPFHMLYPTGMSQDTQSADPRYAKYYEQADIIAGDAHLILRHLPDNLAGKGVVTNTIRPHMLDRLAKSGVDWVVTTTPLMDGVSGGTNVMEAALVALMEKPAQEITTSDYFNWIERLGWHGAVHPLRGV